MWTWSRKELKTNAKAALKRSFWKDLLAMLLVGLIGSAVFYCAVLVVNACTGGQAFNVEEMVKNVQTGPTGARVEFQLNQNATPASRILSAVWNLLDFFVVVPLSIGLIRFFQISRSGKASFAELFVPLKKFLRSTFFAPVVVPSERVRFRVAEEDVPAKGSQYKMVWPSFSSEKVASPVQALVAAVCVPTITSAVASERSDMVNCACAIMAYSTSQTKTVFTVTSSPST